MSNLWRLCRTALRAVVPACRTEYLSWVGKEMPAALAAGKALDERLLSVSNQSADEAGTGSTATPAAASPYGLSDDDCTQKAAADGVIKILEQEQPTAIEVALALDFTRLHGWSSRPLWSQVAIRYAED